MNGSVPVTGNPEADELNASNPLALLLSMLLDQQVPMEWAFAGPLRLKQRLGSLDATAIAEMDPERFLQAAKGPPAIHRFPGSMAKRIQECCRHIVDHHGGDAAAIWTGTADGDELFERVHALPGFGEDKTKIFIALLAKQFGVKPPGWDRVAAPFSDSQPRSVADIDSPAALAQVRQWKKAMKASGKSKSD